MIDKLLPKLDDKQNLRLLFFLNPKLFLLFKYRAINILKQRLTDLISVLELIKKSTVYINNNKQYRPNVKELELKTEKTQLDQYISKELKSLNFLKNNMLTINEGTEDLLDCTQLLDLLDTEIKLLISNITNRKITIDINDIITLYKSELVNNFNEVLSQISILNNFISLKQINLLDFKDPYDFLPDKYLIESFNVKAVSSSTGTSTTSSSFDIDIGTTNFMFYFPSQSASGAYIIGNIDQYDIPSTSSFYIKLEMKPGFNPPKQIGTLPANTIKIDLTNGTRTLSQILTELNAGFLYPDTSNINTQFCTVEEFGTTGSLLIWGANVDKITIIPLVSGDPARVSAHLELGFNPYQKSNFNIYDLYRLALNEGLPITLFNNILSITIDKDITINSGIAEDLGFTSEKAIPEYYSFLPVNHGDEIYTSKGILIADYISDYLYTTNKFNIEKQYVKVKTKLSLELLRINEQIIKINFSVIEIKSLIDTLLSNYTIFIKESLLNKVNELITNINNIQLNINYSLTQKDKELLKIVDDFMLQHKFDYGLSNFNKSNFDFINLSSQDKLMSSIELIGQDTYART